MEKIKLVNYGDIPDKISVKNSVIHEIKEGLGFNWFSCYQEDTYPAPEDEKRWNSIFKHAEWLNIKFLRFGQFSKCMCDSKGNFMPGDQSFKQLKRVNRWCEEKDATIIIDPWSVPNNFQFEPWEGAPRPWGNPNSNYSLGVKDIDGYVTKFIVPYVKYVVEEMNCKAVKWFNHINEPLLGGYSATPEGIDNHARYVEVLAAIRQGLNEAGLAHIGNMGPDTHTHMYWPIPKMLENGADPDPFIQAYCMHHYHSRFDWALPGKNLTSDLMSVTINEQLAKYCSYVHDHNKPYFVTEVGMFYYGWSNGDPAGIRRHDNVLLETEFIVRALREGTDGVLRWGWLNPGTSDGMWQLLETCDGSDVPVIDPYKGYGTLMRFIGRNAKVLDTDVQYANDSSKTVHAVAVLNKDGSRSLFIVNDHYSECARVTINLSGWNATSVRKIINDSTRKYYECNDINISAEDTEYEDVLTPMSLTVYTTMLEV